MPLSETQCRKKSTLLNAFTKKKSALLSAILPEQRVIVIEEVFHIKGHAFRLIDTAGLSETVDEIEAIGVQRLKKK